MGGGHEAKGGGGMVWSGGELDSEAAVGAEGDGGEVVDGEGAGGDEDGGGFGEFVEEGEEFEFDFEVVGEGVYEEVGGADGVVDGLCEEEGRKTRACRGGTILRAWGAARLRPYSIAEIDR